jgi:hypothetical protein
MQHRFQHPQVAVALDLAKILLGDQERGSSPAQQNGSVPPAGDSPRALSHAAGGLSMMLGSPQNTHIKARLGVCAAIKSMIYSTALRSMEVQRARPNKLFIFSKGCCLPYSMIRILKRPQLAFAFWTRFHSCGWLDAPEMSPVHREETAECFAQILS